MFRVVAHKFGPPAEVLAYQAAERPRLAPGEVLVRMRASTINPSDLIPVTGAYRHRTRLPFVPGYDGVGIVAEAAPGIAPEMLGHRVLPLGSSGNWQTWKAVPASWCVAVPPDISDEQAALAYVNPLTARLMVQAIAPRPGDRIGITAGASAIARMLIRLLAAVGARPIAIVRPPTARALLRDEPAEIVEEGGLLPDLSAGLDAVGGASGARLAAAIRPGGILMHYGLLGGQPLSSASLAQSRATVRLFRLRDWVHSASQDAVRAAMAETFEDIRTGHTRAAIAAEFPLSAFAEALAYDAKPGREGKIILRL